MIERGTYIAVFVLPQARRIEVGRLGCFWFQSGLYLYVGSAQQNLPARLDRHARRIKPLRWHIDYLSTGAAIGYQLSDTEHRGTSLMRGILRLIRGLQG